MGQLSQLDELIESDVLDALGKSPKELETDVSNSEDEIIIEDFEEESESDKNDEIIVEELPPEEAKVEQEEEIILNETIESPTLNTADLATLLSQLLNNKTIEITIKIKD